MDSQYNGLAVFVIPASYLAQKTKFQLMFKDQTRPGESSVPDEIYGFTNLLDSSLQANLANPSHPLTNITFQMKPLPNQAVNANLVNAKINIDVQVIPLNKEKPNQGPDQSNAIALPNQIDRDLNNMI